MARKICAIPTFGGAVWRKHAAKNRKVISNVVTLLSGTVVSFNRLTNDYKTRPATTSLSKPATIHSRLPETLCNREDLNAEVFLPVTATALYIDREAIYCYPPKNGSCTERSCRLHDVT